VYAARGVYVQAADLVRLLKHVIVIITVYAIGLHVTSLCLATSFMAMDVNNGSAKSNHSDTAS